MSKNNYRIDKGSFEPLYHQLKNILLKKIEDDNLKPGDPIDSENEMLKKYNVSRTTIRQAVSELINEGILETIRGKGTFIAKQKGIKLKYMTEMQTFDEQIIEFGMKPETIALEQKLVKANKEIAGHLKLEEGTEVIYLKRLRFADSEPVVVVTSYHPYPLCKVLLDSDMDKNSMYDLLGESEETEIVRVDRKIQAIGANDDESRLLKVKKGFPLHHFLSVGYNKNEVPVECSISNYRGDRNIFSVQIRA